MPVRLKKLSSGRVQVSTPHGVKAKATTMRKAKAQERLLNAIEHNPDFKPTGKPASKRFKVRNVGKLHKVKMQR